MAITAKQAIRHVEHTLYTSGSGIDPIEVVNTAGKLLYSMRSWNFRNKGPATLSLTAAQSYIELPANFGELTEIFRTDRGHFVFRTTLSEVMTYRLQLQGEPSDFWVAVSFEIPAAGLQLNPRLELYPTPEATVANAFTYLYRTRWVDVTDDDGVLTGVPETVEPLFLRMCRQVARSYEDEDVQDYTQALLSLRESLEYLAAVHGDVNTQGSFGPLRNGVGMTDSYGARRFGSFWDRPLNAPS